MRINILHLIDNLQKGGAQTRLVSDLKYIDKTKFNNIVCSLYGNGELTSVIEEHGWRVFNLGMNRFVELKGIKRLIKLIRGTNVDILHTQCFYADVIGRIIGRICGIKRIVATIQSSAYEPDNKFLYSRKRQIVDGISGRMFNDRFIAVSEFVKESIIKRLGYNVGKIEVISNYADTNTVEHPTEDSINRLKQELDISNEVVLAVVGRLNSAKGQRYILDALPEVVAIHPGVRLLVIGDGQDMEALRTRAYDLGIEPNVLFLGERSDVGRLLAITDIFVLLTESEGLCLAILEAMAAGKACVISDIGPNKEIVESGKDGFLVNSSNKREVAARLISLIKDVRLRKLLGKNAALTAKQKYSQHSNVAKLEQLYEKLIQSSTNSINN